MVGFKNLCNTREMDVRQREGERKKKKLKKIADKTPVDKQEYTYGGVQRERDREAERQRDRERWDVPD